LTEAKNKNILKIIAINKDDMSKSNASLAKLESILDEYLGRKAPSLPANIKELLVNFAPWITILTIVLEVPSLLAVVGITAYVSPYMYWAGARLGAMYYVSLVFLVIMLVIRCLSLPGLFSRSLSAWKLLYYSTLLWLVYSLLHYNIVSGLVGTLVSLYLLFQVKSYYK
jgi:uncharacterized membrane protein YtjA (UPF0391 family)